MPRLYRIDRVAENLAFDEVDDMLNIIMGGDSMERKREKEKKLYLNE